MISPSSPWQWVSFVDPDAPEGEKFIGVAIIRADNVVHAAIIAHELGINPGGEVMALPVPERFGDPPPEWDHKLIRDRDAVDAACQRWHGCGVESIGEHEDRQLS